VRKHVTELIVEGSLVFLGVEVVGISAPSAPGIGEPMKDLACIVFGLIGRIYIAK